MSAIPTTGGMAFSFAQFNEAASDYVDSGPADTKALRQEEADGAKAMMFSEYFRKFRFEQPAQQQPARTVLGIDTERRASRG